MKKQQINNALKLGNLFKTSSLLFVFVFSYALFAQNDVKKQNADSNEDLLNQYIKTKGNTIIVFDSSNIKQFWVDNSVIGQKDSFEISLNQSNTQAFESVPLKIQLANVNETQDCKIEVIAQTKDFGFSVLNGQPSVLSTSSKENDFLDYSVTSSVFHLEETQDFTFALKFHSKQEKTLSVKKIIISFLKNEKSSYLVSPGELMITEDKVRTNSIISKNNVNSFFVTGKQTAIFSLQKILTTNNTLVNSVTIKNTGNVAVNVFWGYGIYTKDNTWLNSKNFPFQNINNVLKVISSSDRGDTIIVDSYPDWAKNCHLALNAKEDMSDIPNTFLAGTVSEIKQNEKGQAEITLNTPFTSKIEEGTMLRINGQGGAYLYTNTKNLQPGEEHVFNSTIKKDETFLEYSSKAFPKGVYYVVPVILSYSVDSDKENTIMISNYTVLY